MLQVFSILIVSLSPSIMEPSTDITGLSIMMYCVKVSKCFQMLSHDFLNKYACQVSKADMEAHATQEVTDL